MAKKNPKRWVVRIVFTTNGDWSESEIIEWAATHLGRPGLGRKMDRLDVHPIGSSPDDNFVEVTNPKEVEVLVKTDGSALWVNVNGHCKLRATKIKKRRIEVNDLRRKKK